MASKRTGAPGSNDHGRQRDGESDHTARIAIKLADGWREDEYEPNRRSGEHVYFLHAPEIGRVKIGTSRNPQQRAIAIKSAQLRGTGINLEIVGTIDGGRTAERLIHERFAGHRISGEWFSDAILDEARELIANDQVFYGHQADIAAA